MLIDWFTILAQAFNFLLLVWLLKRFLYKPVLTAIDAREAKIAAELNEAGITKAQAQTQLEELRNKTQALAQRRSELLRKATDEVNAERQRLLDAVRKECETLRVKLADAVMSKRDELNRMIVTRTREEVLAVARKALADLADTSLEDRMAEVFICRLRDLPSQAQSGAALPRSSAALAVVRSAFELAPLRRAAVVTAVRQWLGVDAKLSFETLPELISGIELTVDGRKIAWSIVDYLESLNHSVSSLLELDVPATPAQAT